MFKGSHFSSVVLIDSVLFLFKGRNFSSVVLLDSVLFLFKGSHFPSVVVVDSVLLLFLRVVTDVGFARLRGFLEQSSENDAQEHDGPHLHVRPELGSTFVSIVKVHRVQLKL